MEKSQSHTKMLVHFQLDPDEFKLVKAVYDRLSSESNMIKLREKTQNPNESLHSRVWLRCPKHLNASEMRLDFAAAIAITINNSGYEEGNLHTKLGLPFPDNLAKHLKTLHTQMNAPRKRKMKNKRLERELFTHQVHFEFPAKHLST